MIFLFGFSLFIRTENNNEKVVKEKCISQTTLICVTKKNCTIFLVTVFTLGICYPWAFTMIYNWETKHTVINGKRLQFDGTAAQLFGNWIKWFLLTLITVGIYGLWLPIKIAKWKTMHTSFVEA